MVSTVDRSKDMLIRIDNWRRVQMPQGALLVTFGSEWMTSFMHKTFPIASPVLHRVCIEQRQDGTPTVRYSIPYLMTMNR